MDRQYQLMMCSGVRVCSFFARIMSRIAIRNADILFIPWLLEPASVYAYCLARIVSLAIPTALRVLDIRVIPQLKALSNSDKHSQFQAAAARVNLGYLMVSGAMALLVLMSAPHLATVTGSSYPDFENIVVWVVLGQAAPVLFGATSMLMNVLGRGGMSEVLSGMTMILIAASILISGTEAAVTIAQIFAAGQLTHAAICAILLTQSGVWPGLTAILHKEIKLF